MLFMSYKFVNLNVGKFIDQNSPFCRRGIVRSTAILIVHLLVEQKIMSKKNILIIGGGGREHAIAVALKKSPNVGKLYAIPGNAGIASIAECVPHISATDLDKIIEFVASHSDIYMTVVAPDDPLAAGLVDKLNDKGFRAFGPKAAAAEIEASKAFSKEFMARHSIPTASHKTFSDFYKALEYVKAGKFPTVIKADGLALGKGVIIAENLAEAEVALKDMLLDKRFGSAGNNVVIEEFLAGYEASVLAFCDGTTVVPMVSAEDNKRVFDGEVGPNTGGMGCVSPSLKYTDDVAKKAMEQIFIPTVNGLKKEGRDFKGVIYFGLIIDFYGNPKVIEYNARFGDPETQVVLPRLNSDLLEIFDACIDGILDRLDIKWNNNTAICVCLASGGYPGDIEKGFNIEIGKLDSAIDIYHAGTSLSGGKLVTSGGRVLGVCAQGKNLDEARATAYKNIEKIKFNKMHYRKDIGTKYI